MCRDGERGRHGRVVVWHHRIRSDHEERVRSQDSRGKSGSGSIITY